MLCGTLVRRLNAGGMEFAWKARQRNKTSDRAARRGKTRQAQHSRRDGAARVGVCRAARRIAGTLQAKAEGWMDRETLNKQIASVRDGAADLLEQLAGGATKASKKRPAARRAGEQGVAAAWSTRPARNIVSRGRQIRTRTWRTVRPPRCGRQRRWSRRTGAAGAASSRSQALRRPFSG